MESNIEPQVGPGAPTSSKLFWAVLVLGTITSAIAWRSVIHFEWQVDAAQFKAEALERSLLIRKQFETISATLQDLESLNAVTSGVSPEQFSRFIAPILARQPALKALSWNPVITHSERPAYESARRQTGNVGYHITERNAQGHLVPAATREHYVVVSAIEPLSGNETALGFDVSSEATRRLALERARDTGEFTIAAPISLVQSEADAQGALGFLPTFRGTVRPNTREDRRRNLQGYFVAVVDIPQAIVTALANLDSAEIALETTTTPPGGTPIPLVTSRELLGTGAISAAVPYRDGVRRATEYTTAFLWGGQTINLRFAPTRAYLAADHSWLSAVILFAGLLLTGLTAAIVRVLGERAGRIAQEVAMRTEDLRRANQVLQSEITQRKAAEKRLAAYQQDLKQQVAERTQELRSASTHLRAILDSEPECVKILSADGKLEDMNAAGLEMIEADSLEQVKGCDVYALIADIHRNAFIDLNRRVIGGEACTLEFELVGLQGHRRWVETHAVPLLDSKGGTSRHLAITRDITARKRAEKAQAALEAQLRHAQKLESVGVMAGGIAHDFNNLLQVIVGSSELALDDKEVRGTARKSLEAAHSAALHAAKLCDQMLTYAGRSRPDIHPIHLPELTRSMMDLLKMSSSKNAEFNLRIDDDLKLIDGDEAQVRQILMNLITNASEAIGESPGRINVCIHEVEIAADKASAYWIGPTPTPDRYVAVEVTDTGCGMDAQTREKMFDPFFTTKFTGRGLGLSATLGIIRSHGGFLKVVTAPGQGTALTVLFPVSRQRLPTAVASNNADRAQLQANVLVVDDEESIRELGRLFLEALGCRAVLAADGKAAIARFEELGDEIDVVLLDVTMPRLNGNDTCAVLRRMRPDIPVIFCSGYSEDAVKTGAGAGAFTGFLHKPYRREELASVLHDALHGVAATAASGFTIDFP